LRTLWQAAKIFVFVALPGVRMLALFENVEFWKALAALLWPILILVVFLNARHKLYAFLSRDNLSIKVAGMEISVADATKNLGTEVADLQKRLADLETKLSGSKVPAIDPSQSTAAKDSRNSVSESLPPRSFSILWVDDVPSNNAFLIDQFQKDGVDVKLALSTAQGIKDIKSNNFDAVITDLGREEEGRDNPFAGLDLVKEIRSVNSEIPILVFASYRAIQNQIKLLKAGATKVTRSAVDVQSFIGSIRSERRAKFS
jgi:CheY-like chemotaxis protein